MYPESIPFMALAPFDLVVAHQPCQGELSQKLMNSRGKGEWSQEKGKKQLSTAKERITCLTNKANTSIQEIKHLNKQIIELDAIILIEFMSN